jgi:hypothetical protein
LTTLTITPNAATGSHQLSIVPTGTVTRIQRTDANGSYDVRTLTGQLPWTVAQGTLTLDDYEAANGSATYTVTTAADVVTAVAVLTLAKVWLGVPVTPQFSAQVDAVLDYGAGLDSRATVLEPDGSPFAVVVTRSASSRRGNLELFAGDYPAALALLRLVGRGQVVLLRQSQHAGMDMFFVATSADIKALVVAQGDSRFSVKVSYIEVPRPTSPLSGALGWTWAELKNTYATWGDVFADFATWGDVRTNRTQ